MVLVIGLLFTVLNMYNIYSRSFNDREVGSILFKYTVAGTEYTIKQRERPIHRIHYGVTPPQKIQL